MQIVHCRHWHTGILEIEFISRKTIALMSVLTFLNYCPIYCFSPLIEYHKLSDLKKIKITILPGLYKLESNMEEAVEKI